MTVRRRKGSKAYMIDLYYHDEKGILRRFRRSVGIGRSRKEAELLERQLKRDLERRGFALASESKIQNTSGTKNIIESSVPLKSASFSGFARHWFITYCKANNKPSELRTKEMILRIHLVPFFGDQDLREINQEQILTFIAQKKKERLSPKSINNRLTVLRTMLRAATEWGYMDNNPMNGVKALKEGVKEFDFYTSEETQKFLDTTKQHEPKLYPLFLLAFRTGMRLGELFELRWKDVDLERGMIRVCRNVNNGNVGTPKGGRSRDIPMTGQLVNVLRPLKGQPNGLLFTNGKSGHLSRDIIKHPFWRICKYAGIRKIRLHDIRHSFASQLVMKGVHLQVVQELLGHTDIRMTMRYSHLAPDQHHEAVALLEEKIGKKVGTLLGTLDVLEGNQDAKCWN